MELDESVNCDGCKYKVDYHSMYFCKAESIGVNCVNRSTQTLENKVLFENEEELRNFLDKTIEVRKDCHDVVLEETIRNAKGQGYIRKSVVEEAEEKLRYLIESGYHCDKLGATIDKYSNVISLIIEDMHIVTKGFFELKKENERLNQCQKIK